MATSSATCVWAGVSTVLAVACVAVVCDNENIAYGEVNVQNNSLEQ